MKAMRARPCGRPHVSRILASGSFDNPPIMLDMMLVEAVRECRANVLVMYGFNNLTTASCVDATK
jgi:hypothetical protein